MAHSTRIIIYAVFSIAIFATVACESVDELNATATFESGGIDRDFIAAEATAAAEDGEYDDRLLIIDATATAQAGGIDDRLAKVYAEATADTAEYNATATAEAIIFDATSTAIAIEEAEEDDSDREQQTFRRGGSSGTGSIGTPDDASATPVAAEPTTNPTPTPVLAPTATPQPTVSGPWVTALEAIEIATDAQTGTVMNVTGHISHKQGQRDAGDVSNTTPSPGGGYSSSWGVTILDGEDVWLCEIRNATADCFTLFSVSGGNIAGTDIDSTQAFAIWENNSEWNELLPNDSISILQQLHRESEGSPITWTALVSVHGETSGLRGGNFHWIPESGETKFNTYK